MSVLSLFVGLGLVFAVAVVAAVIYDRANGFDVED